MSWDFETEPEFQKELDWIDKFVREEVEPLDLRAGVALRRPRCQSQQTGTPAASRGPQAQALGLPSRARTRRPGLRPGQACADERDPRPLAFRTHRFRLPGAGFRQRRDSRQVRHARAEKALSRTAARQRDRLVLLDDRAAGRRRPQGFHHARRTAWRQLGDQRREMVLLQRALFLVPDRDGGHGSRRAAIQAALDLHRADRRSGREHRAQRRRRPGGQRHPRLRALSGCPRAQGPSAGTARRRLRSGADAARRRADPSRDAHHRAGRASRST